MRLYKAWLLNQMEPKIHKLQNRFIAYNSKNPNLGPFGKN